MLASRPRCTSTICRTRRSAGWRVERSPGSWVRDRTFDRPRGGRVLRPRAGPRRPREVARSHRACEVRDLGPGPVQTDRSGPLIDCRACANEATSTTSVFARAIETRIVVVLHVDPGSCFGNAHGGCDCCVGCSCFGTVGCGFLSFDMAPTDVACRRRLFGCYLDPP